MAKSEMNEQPKQDWKEARIVEYAHTESEKVQTQKNMMLLPEVIELEEEIAYKQDQLCHIKELYLDRILKCEQLQTGIKQELVEKWDIEDKTFECDTGAATLCITKSLNIRNKEKLISLLGIIGKLPEFVKSFETAKLRKIKDAGLLDNEIASWNEKKSIAISIKEAEQ